MNELKVVKVAETLEKDKLQSTPLIPGTNKKLTRGVQGHTEISGEKKKKIRLIGEGKESRKKRVKIVGEKNQPASKKRWRKKKSGFEKGGNC